MDFTPPAYFRQLIIIFRQPTRAIDIFSTQFDLKVWAMIGVTIITLYLTMVVIILMSGKQEIWGLRDIIAWVLSKSLRYMIQK